MSALTAGCFPAAVDAGLLAYVDDINAQLTVPAGVADKLYAVAQGCEPLGATLISDGQLETGAPIAALATTASDYAICLLAPTYHCGILRMTYITSVLEVGGCPQAESPFDRKLADCKTTIEQKVLPTSATPAGGTSPDSTAASVTDPPVAVAADLTSAAGIVQSLALAGLPIGERVVFTEETDPNDKLGRPGNYIGKASWLDTRITDCSSSDPGWECGGDIELFNDSGTLEDRYTYLGGFATEQFVGGYYMWKVENAIVRVGYALTPTQAADYKNALTALFGQVEEYSG